MMLLIGDTKSGTALKHSVHRELAGKDRLEDLSEKLVLGLISMTPLLIVLFNKQLLV